MAIVQDPVKIEDVGKMFPEVRAGGTHRPEECVSRNKVAILVPYRLVAKVAQKTYKFSKKYIEK